MKKTIYKIRLYVTTLLNNFLLLFINKRKKTYIISSKKYKNKVKEDLMLQRIFIKNKMYCKIVAWEDRKYTDYNIIRSVWGYHNNYEAFIDYIGDINTINNNKLIINNLDKKNQYELLKKYKVFTIPTIFTDNISDIKVKKQKQVVKPSISASGNNTFLVEKESDIEKCKNITNIMIQPYIENIKNGELSIIVIGNEIEYGIIRNPGVFSKYKKEQYIDKRDLSIEAIEVMNKILNIKEYQNRAFMRVDLIKIDTKYKVLEIELVDPSLFIETIPDKKFRNEVYKRLFLSITSKY